jgi:hypothetical protein
VSHHQLRSAPQQGQEFVNQPALRFLTRHRGLKDFCVADPLDQAQRLLTFQPIDHGLYGGVGRTLLLGEGLLDFAYRTGAVPPERFQHLQLEFGEFGF